MHSEHFIEALRLEQGEDKKTFNEFNSLLSEQGGVMGVFEG